MTQESHEVRELKFRNRQLRQQAGSQASTIYRLRCEVAEARELIGKAERGAIRRLEADVVKLVEKNEGLMEENAALREKLSGETAGVEGGPDGQLEQARQEQNE